MEVMLHGSYNDHKTLILKKPVSYNAMPIFEAAGASVVLPVDIILKMEVTLCCV